MDDERPVIIILVFIAVVAWIFVISSFAKSYRAVVPYEKLVTVHDTPSNELREIEAPCEECGQMAFGINGEIACRNEECPLYGIPVKVNE